MTPTRTKRNSKAPNRFSSDNARIETSNATGETIIDYNDKSTSTTHSLAPMNRTIKLKPALREPLKVKLPKLKRRDQQFTKEQTSNIAKATNPEPKIHKIKLPSLSSKKHKNVGNKGDMKREPKAKQSVSVDESGFKFEVESPKVYHGSQMIASSASRHSLSTSVAKTNQSTGSQIETSKLNISHTSKSSDEEKSFLANTSMSSNDTTDDMSRMEIVVSKPDSSNGSGIHCPCGVDDDLGVMVECESCSTWQHGHCINVGTEEEAYEGYICAYCTLTQDKARESLYQLTVGDKFQSRIKSLESSRKDEDAIMDNPVKQQYGGYKDSAENHNAKLTVEELSQAINDLSRVLNSLRVKWRLLTSQAYEVELRIWQNPYWSEEPQVNHDKEKNFYFMDRCKSNLKLNIRNMVEKMEERCQLIEYAISLADSNCDKCDDDRTLQESRLKKASHLLVEIAQEVKEFKNKLKTISS